MKKSKNTISSWLKEHGDPEIDKFVEKNLAITEKEHTKRDLTPEYLNVDWVGICEDFNLKSGDISLEQELKVEEAINNINEVLNQFINQNEAQYEVILSNRNIMKKLMKHEVGSLTNGTHKTNTLRGVTYYELFNTLGQPTYDNDSHSDKVQVEWVIEWQDEVYTIYDWKTYDREYTINELNTWSIGSKVPSDDFYHYLVYQVDQKVKEELLISKLN